MQRVLHYDPIVEAQPLLSKLTRSGYPLYSSGEPSYPWTRAVGGEDRGN